MRFGSAPEKFGLDTKDFDEGLIESENSLIDFGLSRWRDGFVGPHGTCFGNVSFIGQILICPTKYPLAY